MRSQRQYIQDILEAMEAAESFVEDVRFEDLEDSTLDNLIEEAREDHRKGRTKPLP